MMMNNDDDNNDNDNDNNNKNNKTNNENDNDNNNKRPIMKMTMTITITMIIIMITQEVRNKMEVQQINFTEKSLFAVKPKSEPSLRWQVVHPRGPKHRVEKGESVSQPGTLLLIIINNNNNVTFIKR